MKKPIEWMGGDFDPEAFDIRATNQYLRMLKWPHTSMDALGDVMMERFKRRWH